MPSRHVRPTDYHLALAEYAERVKTDKLQQPILPLLDYVPQNFEGYGRPDHLAPEAELFHRIRAGERVYATLGAPPRHGKTTTLQAGIVWLLEQDPKLHIGYASYQNSIALEKSSEMVALALRRGMSLEKTTPSYWTTSAGGKVYAGGVNSDWTGRGLNVLVIDDPVKDRLQAESSVYRQRTHDWFNAVSSTRLEPNGSVIVSQTRWHPDDLTGRIKKTMKKRSWQNPDEDTAWFDIVLPALRDEDGPNPRTLWPSRWPLKEILAKRSVTDQYTWASLYQQVPRARGTEVFGDGFGLYEDTPVIYTVGHGIDLAYSEKTSADHSAVVTMYREHTHTMGPEGRYVPTPELDRYFIVNVAFWQMRIKETIARIRAETDRWVGSQLRWYAAGTEKGVGDIAQMGIDDTAAQLPNLSVMPPKGDKFIRALPLSVAWNAGRVLLPTSSERFDQVTGLWVVKPAPDWVTPFLEQMKAFTGVGGKEVDDMVDAAAACYDLLHEMGDGATVEADPAPRRTDVVQDRDDDRRDQRLGLRW